MLRSRALSSLSRDHHLALVVARELQRADARTLSACTARFVEFLERHELGHFALEEEVLLPRIPISSPGPELARRMVADHESLRAALRELQESPGDATPRRLHEVGERLAAHVRMEERELFPYLETSLGPAELEAIGTRLEHRPNG